MHIHGNKITYSNSYYFVAFFLIDHTCSGISMVTITTKTAAAAAKTRMKTDFQCWHIVWHHETYQYQMHIVGNQLFLIFHLKCCVEQQIQRNGIRNDTNNPEYKKTADSILIHQLVLLFFFFINKREKYSNFQRYYVFSTSLVGSLATCVCTPLFFFLSFSPFPFPNRLK